jgi:hypothetical protein
MVYVVAADEASQRLNGGSDGAESVLQNTIQVSSRHCLLRSC